MFKIDWHDFKVGDMVTVNGRGLKMYDDTFPKDKKIYGKVIVIDKWDIGVEFPEGAIRGHSLDGRISSNSGWWLLKEYLEWASPEETKKGEERS